MHKKRLQTSILFGLLIVLGLVAFNRQAIQDWIRLRGYTPGTQVAALATDDTMTDQARHLFYVNRPLISRGSTFTKNCPIGGEKSVVLGCYVGNDQGIFLYDVTDTRLDGVEQVTAAHEMLHAAYRRLSASERGKVDGWLQDFYKNKLTDQRIKDTIDAYKESEPNDVVNEMHSIFGTEVTALPSPLEQYYKRYFNDRAAVTGYTARYQNEFSGRRDQVAAYDTQLSTLKKQIDSNENTLNRQQPSIEAQAAKLQQQRASGDVASYNAAIPAFNESVDAYNGLLEQTRGQIRQYNQLVSARNAVALQEQELVQALSGNNLPEDQ